MWGAKDKWTRDGYGRNILGEREAIPRMLDAFARHGVRATWATVGVLFCESKDELIAWAPAERPRYADQSYSSYAYLDQVGGTEREDPYHFAPTLLSKVRATPGQEIATHTFSHFYTLEDGGSLAEFRADLDAALAIAADRKVEVSSIVFPRNQYSDAHLRVCREAGLSAFRGNESAWIYRPAASRRQSLARRIGRLADSYVDLTGSATTWPQAPVEGLWDIAASRFLRPFSPAVARFDRMKLQRIRRAMTAAARHGEIFHLWWHPHNFGAHIDENLRFLEAILESFARLRDELGLRSMTMAETARELEATTPAA